MIALQHLPYSASNYVLNSVFISLCLVFCYHVSPDLRPGLKSSTLFLEGDVEIPTTTLCCPLLIFLDQRLIATHDIPFL